MLQPAFDHNCRIHLRADYIDSNTIVAIIISGGSIVAHDSSIGQHLVTDGYMIFFPPNTVIVKGATVIDRRGYVDQISIFGSYNAEIIVNGRHVSIIEKKVEENKNA